MTVMPYAWMAGALVFVLGLAWRGETETALLVMCAGVVLGVIGLTAWAVSS